jgi:hypothetical protein
MRAKKRNTVEKSFMGSVVKVSKVAQAVVGVAQARILLLRSHHIPDLASGMHRSGYAGLG